MKKPRGLDYARGWKDQLLAFTYRSTGALRQGKSLTAGNCGDADLKNFAEFVIHQMRLLNDKLTWAVYHLIWCESRKFL
ncbi:MAG: hypothetical protein ACNA8H_05260, partial [Anaerolineales bacterium]